MRTILKALICLVICVPAVKSQETVAAGTGPVVEASFGYFYLNCDLPSANRISLNGVGTSITADFRPAFGVRADLGYARTSNVLGSGHHSDVLSYLVGPVISPIRRKKLSIDVHTLVGGARVTGTIPNGNGGYLTGYANKLAWAFGFGAQTRLSSSFAVRADVDYLHTAFFDQSTLIRGQENLRAMVSLVYVFGKGAER